MAYADGELDPAVASAVERTMVRDPMIVIKTVEFLKSRRLARAKFAAEPLPVPSKALIDMITAPDCGGLGDRPRRWTQRSGLRLLAACLVLGATTYGAFSLARSAPKSGFAVLERPQISRELDNVATGETIDVAGGHLRAITTVALKDSRLCRQLEFTKELDVTSAVLCRGVDRAWRPVLALRSARKTDGYRPAGGDGVIDRFFDEEGAGPAIEGPEERRRLDAS
jgi:hypothetical protein